MIRSRFVRAREVLLAGALVPCVVSMASTPSPARERGLERFNFTRTSERAIPQFVKAPAIDAPADTEPVGVWENDLAEHPAIACFSAESTPSWEIQQAVNQYMARFVDRYQIGTRWSGSTGTPRNLTWSFVPDTVSIPSGVGEPTAVSNLFAQMDIKFGGIANRAVWIAQFQACFDRWAALTGVNYTFVSNAGNQWDDGAGWGSAGSAVTGQIRGDIRIGMKPIDGVNNVLAYNSFPSNGDMVLDSAENWGSTTNSYRFLRNVILHENGHGLGLNHVCPIQTSKLMEPFLATNFDGPQQDDIRAIIRSYGDAYESNNIIGSASPIGSLSVGGTLTPSAIPAPNVVNASITGISVDGDQDHFSITTASPVLATITATPLGTTYADYPQDSACNNSVVNTNAAQQANLTLEVLTSNGTVMRSATSANIGLAEQLTNVLISGIGNIVRVAENNTPTQSQLYSLTISGTSAPTLTASDATFTDRVELNWTVITGAASYQVLRNLSNDINSATQVGSPVSNTFNDTTAFPGTVYFYWVRAVFGTDAILAAGPDQGSRQANLAPSNDNCGSATTVTGGTVNGTLVGATNDGTATCGNSNTSPDVWYAFTAGTCAGTLTVSTCGTNDTGGVDAGIDTVLSVYGACGGTEIACNDDAAGTCGSADAGDIRDSRVTLPLTGGQSVRIRVARFSTAGPVGPFTLNVNFAPANDLCASAAPIASGAATSFCNVNAGTDGPAETLCNFSGNNNVTNDLWYTYTPIANGRFTVDACASGFDTKVAIYGSACPAAADTALACNDDACGTSGLRSRVSAIGVAGTTYRIRIGGFAGATGNGSLTVFCTGDFNQNGTVTVQDIFDFLAAYFASSPSADVNGLGGVSVQDIFDYLAAYFAGC